MLSILIAAKGVLDLLKLEVLLTEATMIAIIYVNEKRASALTNTLS